MKLTVQSLDPWVDNKIYEIGEGKEFTTWYWSTIPSVVGNSTVTNLIIKRSCHAGCRVEIPRDRILSIMIDTNEHETSQS